MTLREVIFSGLLILVVANPALAQEAASGADASNPTAAVNYQDLRYRYFDLDQGAASTASRLKAPICCTRALSSPMNCAM